MIFTFAVVVVVVVVVVLIRYQSFEQGTLSCDTKNKVSVQSIRLTHIDYMTF